MLLDNLVNVVSNLLAALVRVKRLDALDIHGIHQLL